ncbi:MAG: hypothetical protein H0T62_13270 [Parachlamydiaceae bacterium]|nr:hypothetical protein [Parachlamydiaceae bacterium]
MRSLAFLAAVCIQLSAPTLSAGIVELNMAELFPQQNLIQAVQIEAENLHAEITLNDGQAIDFLALDQWPELSDIAQITVEGPEVQFKVITQSGSEWTRSLGSFDLKLSNLTNGTRKEMTLDLHATPLHKIFEQKDSVFDLGHTLFKTLLLVAKGDIHLYMVASTDLEENTHPSMKLEFELDKQTLAFEVHDQQDNLKIGAWKICANGFGKGSLVDLVLSAIRLVSEECKKMSAESEYDYMLQQVFYGVDLFLDLTAPIAEWTGVTLTAQGDFVFLSKDAFAFAAHFNNHFQLETYDGSWNTSLGSKSYVSVGMEDSSAWSQEFIFKNPAHDLEKAAAWIQQHWTDKLATMLDMPSIKYYSDYFPKYFIKGLTRVMSSLGEIQEDGTVSFKLSSSPSGTFTICGYTPSEIASLLIAKVKELVGGWWS